MSGSEVITERHMRWAMEQGVAIKKGEAGFGRPCVGISTDSHWVDWRGFDIVTFDTIGVPYDGFVPDDAYHKHDCVCVLVHGEDSIGLAWAQLALWLDAIIDGGWIVRTEKRTPRDGLDAMFHGLNSHRLYHPEREPITEEQETTDEL